MKILKLKSEKKKKEKLKETHIDYGKCIKRTKIKDRKIKREPENDFDISIFMKTDHASSKIRQVNYAKLVKGIKKNKNIIVNHREKILEIYGIGIIDEDEHIRNSSSKIFYHLINSSINNDVLFGKMKTCLFHSLKTEKESLKLLNLELCHHFFFTKIGYSYTFFYEFLNNILDCFITLSIEQKIKNVKYIFLLFKYREKFKRGRRVTKGKTFQMKKTNFIQPNDYLANGNVYMDNVDCTPQCVFAKDNVNIREYTNKGETYNGEDYYDGGFDGREDKHSVDDYERIIRRNMLNSFNDQFLIKKDVKMNVQMDTKIRIYTKLLKCLQNFMDEIVSNSVKVDFISLYTKMLKTIIPMIKKKKIILKMEMILIINKFIKRILDVIIENVHNFENFRILKITHYFIVLVISLCLKEVIYFEAVRKKIYLDYISLIRYCLAFYVNVLVHFDFFKITGKKGTEKEEKKGEGDNARGAGMDQVHFSAGRRGPPQTILSNFSNGSGNGNHKGVFSNSCAYDSREERGKTRMSRNYTKYGRKYFSVLLYFYEIYVHRKNKKIFLHFIATLGTNNKLHIENQWKGNSMEKIIEVIEKKIHTYYYDIEDRTVWRLILEYIQKFSERCVEEIIHLCYYIIVLTQRVNAQDSDVVRNFFEERSFLKEKGNSSVIECGGNTRSLANTRNIVHTDNVCLSFPFLTTPFIFLLLVDCKFFINNNFFEMFYEAVKDVPQWEDWERERIMEIISALQSEKYINIVTTKTFDDFTSNLLFFLHNRSSHAFMKNCLQFFAFLNTKKKNTIREAHKGCVGYDENNEIDTLLQRDVRKNLNKRISEKKEMIIDYFLSKSNLNILSFEIIKNLYFVYQNTSPKLLLFIYYLIVKYEDTKYEKGFFLRKEEAMVLLHRVFCEKIDREYICNDEKGKIEPSQNEHEEVFKKYKFSINSEHLYRENFLVFFLRLNLKETYYLFRDDVYSLIKLKSLNESSDGTISMGSWEGIKYTNIILIIKKISYIVSNMNISICEKGKNVNNSHIIVSYLFSLIEKLDMSENSSEGSFHQCDSLFATIKKILLFYFTSFYLFPSLYIRGGSRFGGEIANIGRKGKKRRVIRTVKRGEYGGAAENEAAVEVGTSSGEVCSDTGALRASYASYASYASVERFACMGSSGITTDVITLVSFLKRAFDKPEDIETAGKLTNLEEILPHFSLPVKLFNHVFETEIYYASVINSNFEKYTCLNSTYNFNAHKDSQELLGKFEDNIKVVTFNKLVDLPFLVDIILCSYCMKEEVEKAMSCSPCEAVAVEGEEHEENTEHAQEICLAIKTGLAGLRKFGHEFLEFEFNSKGRLRYANNSNYKNDKIIRKEAYVSKSVLNEVKRIIEESEICKESDKLWPVPDKVGKQELEIFLDGNEYYFTTSKIGSLSDVKQCKDPEGLRVFYYLVQDLKCFLFSLICLHFRIKPV
ncbi:hypothetical protein POVWA2_049780 [Plasmodium ovale wallikeri]|uniref:Uncharacterized protein n=1 Tax=Plasmodium ovale wallikeri TaxID=864142 RepID=A0A1A8ZND4_PLAOA|nr:hypothetical protein POVWA2_049780 [Plasmodium ovale wallikeri]